MRNLCAIYFTLVCIVSTAHAQWGYNILDRWNVSRFGSSLIHLSNGNPVVVYTGTDTPYEVNIGKFNGSSWTWIGNNAGGAYTSIALASTNDDSIFYYDKHDGTNTELRRSNGTAVYTSTGSGTVAIDATSNGANPIVHFAFNSGADLYYRRSPTPNTDVLVEAGSTNGHIALDNSGNPHIVFYRNGFLKYATQTGNGWETWPVDPPIVPTNVNFIIDETNQLNVYARVAVSGGYAVKRIVIQP